MDFRRQVNLGDRVHVESSVEKLGNSSVTLRQTIYANDELAADVQSVVVHFDYAAQRAKPLSDEMRSVLAQYVSPPR
jgi:acyl-CoA thioester hydrolase